MKTKDKLSYMIYGLLQKKPRTLREIYAELEKTIESDRATRVYLHNVRKQDRDRALEIDLEHRIFFGKKKIITKTIADLIKRGILAKLVDSEKPWDRVYKVNGPYISRGKLELKIEPIEKKVSATEQKSTEQKKVSAKDTHFKISLPIWPMPQDD